MDDLKIPAYFAFSPAEVRQYGPILYTFRVIRPLQCLAITDKNVRLLRSLDWSSNKAKEAFTYSYGPSVTTNVDDNVRFLRYSQFNTDLLAANELCRFVSEYSLDGFWAPSLPTHFDGHFHEELVLCSRAALNALELVSSTHVSETAAYHPSPPRMQRLSRQRRSPISSPPTSPIRSKGLLLFPDSPSGGRRYRPLSHTKMKTRRRRRRRKSLRP